jgi:hypothetical protein
MVEKKRSGRRRPDWMRENRLKMEGAKDFVSERANQNGIDFLFIDLDLANTFMDVGRSLAK